MNFNCYSDQVQIIENMFVVGIFFSSVEGSVVDLNIFSECEYTTVFKTCFG